LAIVWENTRWEKNKIRESVHKTPALCFSFINRLKNKKKITAMRNEQDKGIKVFENHTSCLF
jgi:hypothetical protein